MSLEKAKVNAVKAWPVLISSGDPNISTDVLHLATAIQQGCEVDLADVYFRKDQVVGIVEIVEEYFLKPLPASLPVGVDARLAALRFKKADQLIKELNRVSEEVLKCYPQLGSKEESILKSLYMWHGCINIDKACRKRDANSHCLTLTERLNTYAWLFAQSQSNIWIRKGIGSARCFRQTKDQRAAKVYEWIPADSPYWE